MAGLKPVFISQGDAAGIGWPLYLKTLTSAHYTPGQMARHFVVGYAYQNNFSILKRKFKIVAFDDFKPAEALSQTKNSKPVFISLGERGAYEPGRPARTMARDALKSFRQAISLLKQQAGSALVTLPLSKEQVIKAGFRFRGHTEELAEAFRRPVFMCMYHEKFSLVLLTTHIPISDVSHEIKEVNYQQLVKALKQASRLLFRNKPLAMLGLNPHAGENGKIGTEEAFLKKKIALMNRSGIEVKGPVSADSFFSPVNLKHYAAAIACYHDQGLIPFKTMFQLEGLNLTLNLPRLRVSPDHGVAYDLARKGGGDAKSILYSVHFALKWGQRWS